MSFEKWFDGVKKPERAAPEASVADKIAQLQHELAIADKDAAAGVPPEMIAAKKERIQQMIASLEAEGCK